jgi:hypothetical protein
MALANYTDLQASVASWINRADLTPQIPDFISIAESVIADDVRVREMLVSGTLATTPNVQEVALPVGWLEFRSVRFNGEPLEPVTPDELRRNRNLRVGELVEYSIDGANMLVSGTQTVAQTMDVSYYKKLDALSLTFTNFLLTKYPQIYLYGALAQAALFMIDDPRAATWQGVYDAAVTKANDSSKKALISGGPLRMRNK